MNTFPRRRVFYVFNAIPRSFEEAPTFKALKTRLKGYSANQAFCNVDEFLAFDWMTAQLTD